MGKDYSAIVNTMLLWWLDGPKAAEVLKSVSVEELGSAETMRDHDLGEVVISKWPTWFSEFNASCEQDALAARLKWVAGPIIERRCRKYVCGVLGLRAKEALSKQQQKELSQLLKKKRVVASVQEE